MNILQHDYNFTSFFFLMDLQFFLVCVCVFSSFSKQDNSALDVKSFQF